MKKKFPPLHQVLLNNWDEDLLSNTVFETGQWYHIVALRNGTTQALYVNGVLDNSRGCSSNLIDWVVFYDNDTVSIGRFSRKYAEDQFHFHGMLSDVPQKGEKAKKA
ncbi:MAG: LamG-like jellyroll fold domain-containing protein [bacterium]